MKKSEMLEVQMEYPPKVKAMFEAVLELFASGHAPASIKVSEITAKAGIGKGTAYEYFSTKEEIVIGALDYEAKRQMDILFRLFEKEKSFRDVIQGGMDLMEEANEKYHGFAIMENIMNDSGMEGRNVLAEMERYKGNCDLVLVLVKKFIELGQKEGAIKETSFYKVQSAIISQFVSYAFYLTSAKKFLEISKEDAREFAYESIIKMLN